MIESHQNSRLDLDQEGTIVESQYGIPNIFESNNEPRFRILLALTYIYDLWLFQDLENGKLFCMSRLIQLIQQKQYVNWPVTP